MIFVWAKVVNMDEGVGMKVEVNSVKPDRRIHSITQVQYVVPYIDLVLSNFFDLFGAPAARKIFFGTSNSNLGQEI